MLWVGQFSIVDGEAREESPWIGVFPESARVEPEESSDLFVIVEPALEGSEEYCRDLSQVIGKQFRERRLSLTSGPHGEFWPASRRHELHEGDRLILLRKDLAAALSDEELTEALQQLPEETLPRLYLTARGMPHCAALLVAALPDTAAAAS